MVSSSAIISVSISALISIAAPVGLFFFLRKKHGISPVPMYVGMGAFVVAVLVLESMVHMLILQPDASGNIALQGKPVLYMLYGGFMAGIFEESARFFCFMFLKKKHHGINTGLSYGIGHGGIEAILLGGLAMISNLVFCYLINSDNMQVITGSLSEVEAAKMNTLVTALTTTAPHVFLLSGFERLMALCIQMSLSVLVWYAVNRKGSFLLFPLAILIHAVIDFPAALTQAGSLSMYITEVSLLITTPILMFATWKVHKKLKVSVVAE